MFDDAAMVLEETRGPKDLVVRRTDRLYRAPGLRLSQHMQG